MTWAEEGSASQGSSGKKPCASTHSMGTTKLGGFVAPFSERCLSVQQPEHQVQYRKKRLSLPDSPRARNN